MPAGLPQGLIPWEITLAQLISGRGYATRVLRGVAPATARGVIRKDRGFDEWYGHTAHHQRKHVHEFAGLRSISRRYSARNGRRNLTAKAYCPAAEGAVNAPSSSLNLISSWLFSKNEDYGRIGDTLASSRAGGTCRHFVWYTFASQRQVVRAAGFCGGRLLIDARRTFWTLTAMGG